MKKTKKTIGALLKAVAKSKKKTKKETGSDPCTGAARPQKVVAKKSCAGGNCTAGNP